MKHFSTFLLLGLLACRAEDRPLVVFAASSLREVLADISERFEKQGGRKVYLQCDASSTLARQIHEGASADVFVSTAPEWLDAVHPQDRFDWLGNRLVLVAREPIDPAHVDVMALANEQVPAGAYAKAALHKLGLQPRRVIYGANVRDVLSKVSNGAAQAGAVYATDAAVDPQVRIVYEFPPDSYPRIVISVGRLTPQGRAFFDTLRRPWALEAARRRGFQ
jgi:molybdate transport system substrate-binding protein